MSIAIIFWAPPLTA